jgi:hypothetical protein
MAACPDVLDALDVLAADLRGHHGALGALLEKLDTNRDGRLERNEVRCVVSIVGCNYTLRHCILSAACANATRPCRMLCKPAALYVVVLLASCDG